jgi:putative nucleotidyltransferase with HDIG domain
MTMSNAPAVDQLPASGSEATREDAAAAGARETGLGIRLSVLIWTLFIGGVALAVYGTLGAGALDWKALFLLAFLAVVSERLDLSVYGESRVSLAVVPIFASLVLFGLPGLALVVPVAVIASAVGTKRPAYKTAFNFGVLMVAAGLSAASFQAFGNIADELIWPQVIGPALLAAGVNFAANSVLVAAAIALSSRTGIHGVWTEHFRWLWPHYLVLGLLGLAIASAYNALGIWGILFFLAPPAMMQVSLKQYLDRTTKGVLELRAAHHDLQTAHGRVTDAMSSLRSAYDGTLRSLVAALDARDSETGGHSERVADLTAAIAEEMGISRDSEAGRFIQWGALLHDVGKIAVPDHILRKPGSLSDEEWETMRTHPHAGFQIVRNVGFLAPAAQIVLAHHERFDGRGYPHGLAGEEIPLGSRIFMIADTFDAITSERPYKAARAPEEALAEILRHSGSQFDPDAVQAFLSVYQRRFVQRGSAAAPRRQLSTSLKKAILEATAGLDTVS